MSRAAVVPGAKRRPPSRLTCALIQFAFLTGGIVGPSTKPGRVAWGVSAFTVETKFARVQPRQYGQTDIRFGSLGPLTHPAASFCTNCHSSLALPSRRILSSSSLQTQRYLSPDANDGDSIATTNEISQDDVKYMNIASQHARLGMGNTYPNPAVGCVLVRCNDGETDDDIIGAGFHPRAGLPHAEVFALFEACGRVDDGVEAARTIVSGGGDDGGVEGKVRDLLDIYSSDGGPAELFGGAFESMDVTAYVTLEPCCHYGQTPPCARSLVEAGVRRVMVGYRDPNPRVDGGGVKLLRDAGIRVDLMRREAAAAAPDGGPEQDVAAAPSQEEIKAADECASIVACFAKRIAPRPEGQVDYEAMMNGAKRSALRSLAARMMTEGTLVAAAWPSRGPSVDTSDGAIDLDDQVNSLPLNHRWLENLDRVLWEKELVLVRLNKAVKKKRGVKILGKRIADDLNAHLAQVKGHTALFYRPGLPPVLDLNEMAEDQR